MCKWEHVRFHLWHASFSPAFSVPALQMKSSDACAAFLHSSQLTTTSGATAVFVVDVVSVHVPSASCCVFQAERTTAVFLGKYGMQSRLQNASCR